ncbi:hypothetical protein D9758_013467 [Tetrapyrgos nigripes]|uniref:Uncharacterized protein n=1 Tax=Tetrapyrgos nigripes TaxID=182062 RepID=A0A8H5CSJ8_9AGAR|nr:hypothetical protein D9758_013467 [Tetrapyrgos nigripes]
MLSFSSTIKSIMLVSGLSAYAATVPVSETRDSQTNSSTMLHGHGPGQQRYSAVVAFGDSFSDNGHGAWVISNHSWPAHPGYYQGRFSNGPVWVEYVAGNLSVGM